MAFELYLSNGQNVFVEAGDVEPDASNNLRFSEDGRMVRLVANGSWGQVLRQQEVTPGPVTDVAVPDWIGQFHEVDTYPENAWIAGLLEFVNDSRAVRAGEEPWSIVEMHPAPGTIVPAGTVVTKVIANPNITEEPDAETVVVPNAIGQDYVNNDLEAMFQVGEILLTRKYRQFTETETPDTVVEISPAPGTVVPRGTMVTVTIGTWV